MFRLRKYVEDLAREVRAELTASCLRAVRRWTSQCPRLLDGPCRRQFHVVSDVVCPSIVDGVCRSTDAAAHCRPDAAADGDSEALAGAAAGVAAALADATRLLSLPAWSVGADAWPPSTSPDVFPTTLRLDFDVVRRLRVAFWVAVGLGRFFFDKTENQWTELQAQS